MSRLADVVLFYALLDQLEQRRGRTRTLATFDKELLELDIIELTEKSELMMHTAHCYNAMGRARQLSSRLRCPGRAAL